MLQNYANNRGLKAYGYLLNSVISSNPWPKWMGVMHGYEIEYIFGIPIWNKGDKKFLEEEQVLSQRVLRYWTNFAKGGFYQNSNKYY